MKQRRFYSAFGICALAISFLSYFNSVTYAGNRPGAPLQTQTAVPRAYLALDSQRPAQLDPLFHLSSSSHETSIEALAYKISFVGGLLLTADRLVRSVDSVMDTPLLKSDDGSSYVRINTAPTSKGFMVGFLMGRSLDF